MKFKAFDYIAFAVSLAVLFFVFTFAASGSGNDLQVRVESPGGEWRYPLDSTVTFEVPGPLGNTEVSVKNGKVWVIDSPCTEKICVTSSPISRAGTWIACLPNRVFVKIEGTDSDAIDAGTF